MATKKKRKEMVFQKECTNGYRKASKPPLPAPSLVLLKPGKAEEGDGTIVADKVEDCIKMPSTGESPPTTAALENLPAMISCHGVSVTLDNNVMWNKFFRCQTEMILTKDGSRMFPYCRFRISGLDASQKYSLLVDIQPLDSSRYEWTGHQWQVAGKASRHLKSQAFSHPDSPSTGQHWMEQPVSFYKLKLTNVIPGQGNLVLHPQHRYIPRLLVVPFSANGKKDLKLNGPRVATFTFPQTEFFAVTAYQNSRFTQLKVNYNPFAKGLNDERSSFLALKPKSVASKDLNNEPDPSNNQTPLVKKSLKCLLANHKPRSSPVADHQHSDTLIPAATSSTEELSSQAKPSRKLFSELIREAHVSLRRCNLDKMVTSMQSTCKVKVPEFELPVPTVCPAVDEKSTTAACPAPKSPIKAVMSPLDSKNNSEPQPEVNARPHKRPALVPLPALARFLSKHQSKHKNVGSRQESLNKPPPEATPPSKTAPCDRSTVGSQPRSTLHHPEPTQEGQVLAPQIVVPKPKVPDCTLVLPSIDLPLSTSEQIDFSTSAPEGLPTAIDSILADITDSSTIAPCVSTNQPASLLPDSSPIGFESLSPVSSPEPLPPLHVSLGLETLPSPSAVDTTLKWHSLFPQPDPFLTSYAHFYPTTHSPTLSLQHQPSQEAPSVTPDPLLPEDEYQSLPFPGELSPLNLQLSMSPSFSSLDGGALSPSPSLSDILSFISNDHNNLLLEAEVVRAEPVLVPCPPPPLAVPIPRPDPVPPVEPEPEPTTKPMKGRKKGRKEPSETAPSDSDPVYTKMQPSLEEVEEQLFVSFTSKEALKLHIQEPHDGPGTQPLESSREDPQPNAPSSEGEPCPQSTPPLDTGEIGATATGEHASSGDVVKDYQESIAAFQKVLLLELKLMKNRQVIHPVLQEVGLKMHLLDSALAIDLQYLGVRLPIPPHPFSLEAQAPTARAASPQTSPRLSVCLDFVSRTGKTSDITQIKGWREKFPPSESSTSSSSSRPEAAVSAEHPSKNLSAFCSDMLDEYLENEGKFLDQHASSFSQAPPEPVAYKLPVQSSSYVRTLGSVVKKQRLSAPTSALISSFVPPSKRPRLPPTPTKKLRRDGRQKTAGLKLKAKPAAGTGDPAPTNSAVVSLAQPPAPATSQASLATPPKVPSQTQDKPEAPPPPAKTAPPPVSTPANAPPKKTKKLKSSPSPLPTPKTPASKDLAWGVQNLAPLESDSELGPAKDESPGRPPPPPPPLPPPPPRVLVSVTLLKQRDLEEAAVWEGRPRTCVTEERASVALTSLFTSAGFVREDPTAPIQLVKRPTPACLKDFCLLGCVCSSLAQSRLITHCGKMDCMLGCSCLRQKVVLLKNLDGSDSGSSEIDPSRRKRKRRMKMAYVLKETESVAQPAQPVRTLWKGGDVDPEPMFTPEHLIPPKKQVRRGAGKKGKTCARVRGYTGRKTLNHARKLEGVQETEEEHTQILKKTTSKGTESPPDRSKHLVIVAECRWPSTEVQNQVLKAVCQAMAQEKLHKPFRIGKYHVKLLSFNIREGIVHYKVHISEGKADPSKTLQSTTRPGPTGPSKTGGEETEGGETVQDYQEEVRGESAVEYWQKEVEGEEDVEYWQREVEGEETEEDAQKEVEEQEALEPWQKEVEEEEAEEDAQKEVEGEEALEPWQKEVEGEETEEDPQKEVEEEEALEPWQKEMEEEEAEEDPQKEVEEEEAEEDPQKEVEEEEALEPWQKEMEEEEAEEDPQKEVEEEEAEEDPQKEVEEEEALEPWQKEVEEEEAEEDPQKEMETDKEDLKEVKKRMMKMALPFLSGLSHAGFLSANLKAAGGGSLLVQVNGKPYPNAMVQLGRMGALHPANRLAAYLTGRVCPTQPPAPPASSTATVSTATTPPASDLQSPRVGTTGSGLSSQRTGGRMIRLVPLSQLRNPKGRDGTPGNNEDRKSIFITATGSRKVIRVLSVEPAPSAGTCRFRLVPAGDRSKASLSLPLPKLPPLTPAGSSGTDQNVRAAGSSGTNQNVRAAGSNGTDQSVRAAGSSGTDQNVRAAGSSGTNQSVRAAGSSGTNQNVRAAGSSGTNQNVRAAGSSGTNQSVRAAGSSGTNQSVRAAGSNGTDQSVRAAGSSGTDQSVRAAGSNGTDQSVRAAGSSGTDQSVRAAGSSGTNQSVRAAGSSGTNQSVRAAGSSGTNQSVRAAGSSGTNQNGDIRQIAYSGTDLNIICVDNESDVLTNEGHVGVARTSSRASSAVVPRAEHDVVVLSSSDLSDSSLDSKREDGPGDGARRDRRNSRFRLLEAERRKAINVGVARLQKEMGLGEKTPKVTTTKQAREELLELRSSEGKLARLNVAASLRRQRGEHIRALALRTGRSEASVSRELLLLSIGNTQPGWTGSDPPLAPEVVARMEETDSDEENLPSDAHDYIGSSIRGDGKVDIEALADDVSNTAGDKKCLVTAYKSLRSELNSMTATKTELVASAYSVICDLKDEEKLCEKVMAALRRQRARLINTISVRSGRSTRKILEKLQSITAKQRQLEERRPRFRPAETATPLDLSSTARPRSQLPAPPCAAQLDPQPPPPTARSPHSASRLKTVPNILTRRKPPSPPLSPSPSPPVGWSESREAPAFHTSMMPAGLVSFLCPLPGQQVLTLKHMAYEPGAPPPNPDGPFTTLLYLVPSNTALQQLQGPAVEEPGSLPQPQTLQAGSLPQPQTLQAGSLPHPQTLFSAGAPPPHQTFPAGSIPHPQTLPSGVPGAKLEECGPRPLGPPLPAAAPPSETRPALLIPDGGKALFPPLNQLSFLKANIGPPADRTALSSVPGHPFSSLGREPHKDGPLGPSLSTEDLTEATQVDAHLQNAAGPEPNGCHALHYPQCSSTSGTLTLPPLLQMNVGGTKVSESTNKRAVGAWKPMPRLAAMGVKGGTPHLTSAP
ncbi:MAX dimerization protein MGA a isoform X3 [Gadus chalcogrammus]|uniref:MAX dimerization protein MGA a isoform X3 n=1 Tax=Gadus chalcogrammus TaxID=1042646 RepID=UPI0024C279C0|nr:MAX dimerization protein MGA a isoform X3 [Gadus chalcogrammus]